ncbi:unnamed protein product [Arctia plantaginis]|uniref:Carboxylesterase type B domain-containing protein n=1 Tax=Arctia plantaginis TaxID=874455 RepID=A0A8S1ANA0_ARCPL|nr:unnamed protein product [Arctia plantaginis]
MKFVMVLFVTFAVVMVYGQGIPTRQCPSGEHSVLYCPQKAEPSCDNPTVHKLTGPSPCGVPQCFCNKPTTEKRVVTLDVGEVIGEKYWNGDFFEFYGVPYAKVPKGRDRFKAPLPLEDFGSLVADIRNIHCPQIFLKESDDDEDEVFGQEDCLNMNLLVPSIASEKNLVPVLVYIHSGGYSGGNGNIKDLNEFLLNADIVDMTLKTHNFFLENSTFGFAPCLENVIKNTEPIITESPLMVLQKGDYKQMPVLTGFANMEGISRTFKFDEWSEAMNENFADFLPADLTFDTVKSRDALIEDIKQYYFKGEEVSHDTLKGYVDYFSDAMFKYSIMKSAKLHASKSNRPVFLYEFTYVGKLSLKHYYMDKLDGASHRDQTSYLLDFFGFTDDLNDLETRDRMTAMWTDFVKFENPTAYESLLIDVKWRRYTKETPNYMKIGKNLQLKKNLFSKTYAFWDNIYDKYYWSPTPVSEAK